MKKKTYEQPKMKVVKLEQTDIICASTTTPIRHIWYPFRWNWRDIWHGRRLVNQCFKLKKTSKTMKKTIWSLAALMLMAATMMTSCNNSLDEVEPAEEVQSRVVTITIAPPAAEPVTRVTMEGMKITGWQDGENADKVNLYAITNENGSCIFASGTSPITLTCTNATAGTFSGTLPEGVDGIGSYNLAVYGATAVDINGYIGFLPKIMCSTALKDVVIMAAYKSSNSYTMQIVNNVLKINNSGSDIEAAWRSVGHENSAPEEFRIPFSGCSFEENQFTLGAPPVEKIDNKVDINNEKEYTGWGNAKHFTLKNGVSYVNAGMFNNGDDQWGIATKKTDADEVDKWIIALVAVGQGKAGQKGKIWNAGEYNGTPIEP